MTTNLVNGKIYIGKHETENLDDGYLGSGKNIRRAIEKYSEDSFSKDVLFIFDNEDEMNTKEAELVTEEFIKLSSNYNLCPGGKGGFGYINSNGLNVVLRPNRTQKAKENIRNANSNIERRNRISKTLKEGYKSGRIKHSKSFLGKTHTKEWRIEQSKRSKNINSKQNNPNFGKKWVNNGEKNFLIFCEQIPEGYSFGKIKKFKQSKSISCIICENRKKNIVKLCENCKNKLLNEYESGMKMEAIILKYGWKCEQNVTTYLRKTFPNRKKFEPRKREMNGNF